MYDTGIAAWRFCSSGRDGTSARIACLASIEGKTFWLGPSIARSARHTSVRIVGPRPRRSSGGRWTSCPKGRKWSLLSDPDDHRPVLSQGSFLLGRLVAATDMPKGCRFPQRARGNAGFTDSDHRGQRLGVLQPGNGRLVISQRSEARRHPTGPAGGKWLYRELQRPTL